MPAKTPSNRKPAALAVAVLSCWAMVAAGPALGLAERWSSEDFSYCWLVPVLFLYLLWDTRAQLLLGSAGARWPGIVLMIAAICLGILGKAGSLEIVLYFSLWLSLAGSLLVLLGTGATSSLAFPFIILLFAIPLPAFLNNMLSFKLRMWSSALAVQGLQILGVPSYREGNIIDLGVTQLQVVDACSGLRFLFPTVLMALLLGRFVLKRFWPRAVLVALSPLVAVFSNAFRITMTGILVKYVSPQLAEGFFHDFSGWMVYMFSLGILLATAWGLRRMERRSPLPAPDAEPAPDGVGDSGPAPLPWAPTLLAAALLVGGYLVQDQVVGSQLAPTRTTFRSFPVQIGAWTGERLYLSQAVLDNLWADDYVTGNFRNPATGNVLQMLVSYYSTQTTQHTAHAPTSCLLGGGWVIEAKHMLQPNPSTGRDFPVQSMVMARAGQRIISNFWFDQRGRHITSEYMNKVYLAWDALTRKRTDGALVRVEMYLLPSQSVEQGQEVLDGFLVQLNAILRPYIPGANLS